MPVELFFNTTFSVVCNAGLPEDRLNSLTFSLELRAPITSRTLQSIAISKAKGFRFILRTYVMCSDDIFIICFLFDLATGEESRPRLISSFLMTGQLE
jgi:hypothetical protein